jgi:hypothetical protein
MKKDILIESAREYYASGEDEYRKQRFNSAVVLYFKSLVACIDLFLYTHTGKTPSSHTDRFRITQGQFPEIYEILDKDFPFYQDSYVQRLSAELAGIIRDDSDAMAEKAGITLK